MYAVLPPGYIVKRIEIGASFNTSSVSRSQTFDILVDDVVFAVPGSNIYLSH
jgi:hypothetical protein